MVAMTVFTICCLLLIESALAADWTYTRDLGVNQWSEHYPTCSQSRQSPIDIFEGDVTVDDSLTPFTFTNYDSEVTMELTNNGHSALVTFGADTVLSISGGGLTDSYRALQMHFHWGDTSASGSEHLVSRSASPMELHIVHYNTKYTDINEALRYPDGLAVLGFLFEITEADNENYHELVSSFPKIQVPDLSTGIPVKLTPGALNSFLPSKFSHFYRYPGSLTTPGCDEAVIWTVFTEKIKISEQQLEAFRTLTDPHHVEILENHRPVQPLNDRIVTANFEPHIHWSYKSEEEWSNFYESCSKESQSPIKIEPDFTQADDTLQQLTFNNYDGSSPVSWTLRNSGHAAQVDIAGPEMSVSDGGLPDTYVASQLHFHWGSHDEVGSEHLIDNQSFPMEVHIVHYRKSIGKLATAATEFQGLAVLGFFFEVTAADNPALNPIISNLNKVQLPDSFVSIPAFSLDSILPTNKQDFYRYDGSLTTPRCLESVIWTVFKDTIKISSAQLAVFRSLKSSDKDETNQYLPLVDNTRKVQSLDGRVVRRNFNLPPPSDYWSYEGSYGPDQWHNFYTLCSTENSASSRQSPVDIRTNNTRRNIIEPLRLEADKNYTFDLINSGHTAKIAILGNRIIYRGGLSGTYKASNVHFHWGSDSTRGSEHTIDGNSYPMEMHIVHYNTKFPDVETASLEANGLAVVAVLVEISATPNSALNFFFDSLESITQPGSKVRLEAAAFPFLPADTKNFYRYSGSLTTPGCYETVTWTVFRDTVKVSESQIAKLRLLQRFDPETKSLVPIEDNYRPIQPINGRTVSRNAF